MQSCTAFGGRRCDVAIGPGEAPDALKRLEVDATESKEARWFRKDQLPENADPHLPRSWRSSIVKSQVIVLTRTHLVVTLSKQSRSRSAPESWRRATESVRIRGEA